MSLAAAGLVCMRWDALAPAYAQYAEPTIFIG
jgi:hypothetical protein